MLEFAVPMDLEKRPEEWLKKQGVVVSRKSSYINLQYPLGTKRTLYFKGLLEERHLIKLPTGKLFNEIRQEGKLTGFLYLPDMGLKLNAKR